MPRKVVYVSKCTIERRQGPIRHAQLPGEAQPVIFSVHGAIAKHYYGINAGAFGEPHASTIDYLVAAVGG